MVTNILILLALSCFALTAIIRREWSLYLIILLLPAYQIRFHAGPVPMTLLEGMILILTARELKNLFKIFAQDKIGSFLIGLFLLAAAAAVFTSPVRLAAAGIFKAFFLEAVLFYYLVRAVITRPEQFERLAKILALLVFYLSVYGIYQFITLANLPFSWWAVEIAGRRITSLVNHPNALALLITPLLALLVMSLATAGKKLRGQKFLVLSIILGLAAVYLSFSRAALLALILALGLFGLLTPHRKKILAAAGLIVIFLLAVPVYRQKLADLARGRDPSQRTRYFLWDAALDLLKNNPVSGLGLMGFHENFKNYPIGPDRVVQNYPHNFILNFWLEIGLGGLVAVLALLTFFYKKILFLYRKSWPWALPAAAAMAVILLHGLVDVPYFKNDLSVLFWLLLATADLGLRFYQNPTLRVLAD